VTQLLHNNCLSFRQLKCGESHMTYLARNPVKSISQRLSTKMWQLPSRSSEGQHFCYHLLTVEGAFKNFKTTRGSSRRTALFNNLTFSQSQSHATVPLSLFAVHCCESCCHYQNNSIIFSIPLLIRSHSMGNFYLTCKRLNATCWLLTYCHSGVSKTRNTTPTEREM
jgi:hypothetical protein